jgi:hypothetical protein
VDRQQAEPENVARDRQFVRAFSSEADTCVQKKIRQNKASELNAIQPEKALHNTDLARNIIKEYNHRIIL